jgi:serine/threonine protein kinase
LLLSRRGGLGWPTGLAIPAPLECLDGETSADGTGRVWIVIQLLHGSTLEALLDRAGYASSSPPSVAWATAIATQIAAVLTDVHRIDIVHRDLKPANVMIVDGGKSPATSAVLCAECRFVEGRG